MNTFDWRNIKGGFAGFESFALRFVNSQFPSSSGWNATGTTRDGNRDAYTVIVGFQPYPTAEEQWWMEAKYSTEADRLTRYRLDATVVSAILCGNVSKVIFVTNIVVNTKTILDIRMALYNAVHCREVFFCTKYTLEYWLSQNPEIANEFFGYGGNSHFEFPELFVIGDMEFYSIISQNLSFQEPIRLLQRGKRYCACFSVFCTRNRRIRVNLGRHIKGITFCSSRYFELNERENHLRVEFKIDLNYTGGNGQNGNSGPVFQIGGREVVSKYIVEVAKDEVIIELEVQQNILSDLKTQLKTFQAQNFSFCYCLQGNSGVGKSFILDQFVLSLETGKFPLFSLRISTSVADTNRMLLEMLLFIYFPYLAPETIDEEYLLNLKGCYLSSLLKELVASKNSFDKLCAIFSSVQEDSFFPTVMSINQRIVILDDLHKLGPPQKHFLIQLLLNALNRKIPLFFILCGQSSFFCGEFEILRQHAVLKEQECVLSSADILKSLPLIETEHCLIDPQFFSEIFPNLVELLSFRRYIATLKEEINGPQSFILAGQSFFKSRISEQEIINQFSTVLAGNEELNELCNSIYWSEDGIPLPYRDFQSIRNAATLLSMKLVRYRENNYIVPYHDIYQRYYRHHFHRPTLLHFVQLSSIQTLQETLDWQSDRGQLWNLVEQTEQMIKEHKFYSAHYLLEYSFTQGNRDMLISRLGEQIYYKLYMCFAMATANVSVMQSGREIFKRIKEETWYSTDAVILEVCEDATWELVNSLYEWLEFDKSISCIEDLFSIIQRLQLLGRRDNEQKKCNHYHDAMVIRTLIKSEQRLPDVEADYQTHCKNMLAYDFIYRYHTFKVRYGLTIMREDMKQAHTIMLESVKELMETRGPEDRYYLWSSFAAHYLDLLLDEKPGTLQLVLNCHEKLKKNFFNDYRKKNFAIAAYYYCHHDMNSGNRYLFQEMKIERELRSRQKAFYYETIALYEYLYGSLEQALDALYNASLVFKDLMSYLDIIRHNEILIKSGKGDRKTAQFCCNYVLQENIYYVDPRCAW